MYIVVSQCMVDMAVVYGSAVPSSSFGERWQIECVVFLVDR